jgi:hypothetical protein
MILRLVIKAVIASVISAMDADQRLTMNSLEIELQRILSIEGPVDRAPPYEALLSEGALIGTSSGYRAY